MALRGALSHARGDPWRGRQGTNLSLPTLLDDKTSRRNPWAEEFYCGCWESRFPSSFCLPCSGTDAVTTNVIFKDPASAGSLLLGGNAKRSRSTIRGALAASSARDRRYGVGGGPMRRRELITLLN